MRTGIGGMENVKYPSGLWDFDDREMSAIETLHFCVELFVADDEDDVYWEWCRVRRRGGTRRWRYFGRHRHKL